MKVLGNIVWLVFGGLETSIGYFVSSVEENKEMKETLDKVAVYEEWAKRKALKAGNNKTTLKIDKCIYLCYNQSIV